MNKQTHEKLKFNKSFKLSGTNIEFELNHKKGKLKQVIINPTIIGFNLEFIYETIKPDLKPYNGRVVGVDLGVSNLMTVVNNYDEPFYIVNSKPIASINRYSNKKISNLQKKLEKNIHTSRQIKETYLKRKFKLDYELNCVSKYLVEECVKQNVTKIIIGNNQGWKQKTKLGVKTNQRFQSIPYAELICKIIYKAAMEGIEVIVTEESYTSKCSFFDNETLTKHKYYAGKRTKRGLFVTSFGKRINADVNGALNIIRKVVHGFNFNEVNIGLAVNPHVVFIGGYNKPKGKLNHSVNIAA
jgi:putative transposase